AVLTVNTIPVFTTHPQSQAVAFGGTATFTALATSSPAPSYQWQKDNVNLPGQTGTTLTIAGVNSGSTGVYTCVAISLAGQTSSNGAGLNTTNSPPAPISQPVVQQTVMSGSSVTLTFNVSGTPTPSIQWYKDGAAVPGATGATYTLTASKANSGTYTASAINSTGTITSSPAYLGVMVPSRLVNVSTRAAAGSGAQTLIAGFVISGGSKSILVRGVGPGIAQYFPAGTTLADPALNILDGSTSVAANEDWGGATALKNVFNQVGAFALTDTSKDAAINATLAGNKVYSATLSGSGGGLAIAEIYDADTSDIPAGRLVNLSTRTQVGTGTGVLIAGFVITGDFPKQVLIRAIGPTLGQYGVPGVLADPQLDLYVAGASTPMLSNDNWGGTAALTTAFNQVGAFALPDANSKDAAILVTLNPGSYSAIVSGVGNTSGVALVEVYDVQ
ncbi:MAG: repeat protein, partial [Verrucomicrobia bacterium]|nr:repeat protein [Verrucomicrobiota bacterium]